MYIKHEESGNLFMVHLLLGRTKEMDKALAETAVFQSKDRTFELLSSK
jgi:hypothetical protein